MKIKIICINNEQYPLSLQKDKMYEAIELAYTYLILDENFEDCEFPKELFRQF